MRKGQGWGFCINFECILYKKGTRDEPRQPGEEFVSNLNTYWIRKGHGRNTRFGITELTIPKEIQGFAPRSKQSLRKYKAWHHKANYFWRDALKVCKQGPQEEPLTLHPWPFTSLSFILRSFTLHPMLTNSWLVDLRTRWISNLRKYKVWRHRTNHCEGNVRFGVTEPIITKEM